MTESQLIDKLLHELQTGYDTGPLDDEAFQLYPTAIRKMKALGLIEGEGRSQRLLEKGYQVIEAGGFEKWQAASRQREDQQTKASIGSYKAGRSSAIATWIATFIAAAASVYGIYQSSRAESKQAEINQLKSTVEMLMQQVKDLQSAPAQTISPPTSTSSPKSATR